MNLAALANLVTEEIGACAYDEVMDVFVYKIWNSVQAELNGMTFVGLARLIRGKRDGPDLVHLSDREAVRMGGCLAVSVHKQSSFFVKLEKRIEVLAWYSIQDRLSLTLINEVDSAVFSSTKDVVRMRVRDLESAVERVASRSVMEAVTGNTIFNFSRSPRLA